MTAQETKKTDRYLTVQHVAERLSCSERYVSELIHIGALIAIKIGPRAMRVSEKSLIEFIEVQRIDPQSYFAPDEKPRTEEKSPRTDRVARSSWMSK